MSVPVELHSRSILSGYDPERLRQARVLVIGLGALGQNVVQNFALLGVGRLLLVDFDGFEAHNATRSPFYPSQSEIRRLGSQKAAVVGHHAARVSTAEDPEVYYFDGMMQVLGDGAVDWADVVVSAVDSVNARAWLAERCRLLGKPMVEAGFSGSTFNFSSFSPAAGAVCYRCGSPSKESSVSCTRYALEAEALGIVPAIQTAAAVVAGYQAEHAVQVLHGLNDGFGHRGYGSVRKPTLSMAVLQVNPKCPGMHSPLPVIGTMQETTPIDCFADLMTKITQQFGPTTIRLAERAVITQSCTNCRVMCGVRATEAAWLADSRCEDCGGSWPISDAKSPEGIDVISTAEEMSDAARATRVFDVGLRSGAAIEAMTVDGHMGLVKISGNVLAHAAKAVVHDPLHLTT